MQVAKREARDFKRPQAIEGPRVRVGLGQGTDQVCSGWQALKRGSGGSARIHLGLPGKGGAGRGHCQQNLDMEITASVTICQVRNNACGLNALQASLPSGSPEGDKRTNAPPLLEPTPQGWATQNRLKGAATRLANQRVRHPAASNRR